MNNQIIKTDLIVTDNIKDYFYLFYWEDEELYNPPQMYIDYPLSLKKKYQYIMINQKHKLEEAGFENLEYRNPFVDTDTKKILVGILNQIKEGNIPKRYMPKKEEIVDAFIKKKGNRKFRFYQISFPEPLISLIEQRFTCDFSRKIVKLFKSLNEHNGMEFEEYIDKWYDKLVGEFFPA